MYPTYRQMNTDEGKRKFDVLEQKKKKRTMKNIETINTKKKLMKYTDVNQIIK